MSSSGIAWREMSKSHRINVYHCRYGDVGRTVNYTMVNPLVVAACLRLVPGVKSRLETTTFMSGRFTTDHEAALNAWID